MTARLTPRGSTPTAGRRTSATAALIAILTAACVLTGAACGHYHGTVVDDETGRPLEGAVVAVIWCKRPIIGMDRPYYFHNAHEAVTDRQGRFSITAFAGIDWSPTTMTESSPEIAINMLGYRPVTTYTHAICTRIWSVSCSAGRSSE